MTQRRNPEESGTLPPAPGLAELTQRGFQSDPNTPMDRLGACRPSGVSRSGLCGVRRVFFGVRRGGGCGGQWQANVKRCTRACLGFERQRPSVNLNDDVAADREALTCAPADFLRGEERV